MCTKHALPLTTLKIADSLMYNIALNYEKDETAQSLAMKKNYLELTDLLKQVKKRVANFKFPLLRGIFLTVFLP